MASRILQFGTSRFLQAHADLFVHEARQQGQDIGPITIVKTTLGGPRDSRTQAFGRPEGFPVKLRGFSGGVLVDETVEVKSVVKALDANRDWHELVELFASDTEIVITNVGDGGYAQSAEDQLPPPSFAQAPSSYPAKFLLLLMTRFERGGKSLLVLPCELIGNNGQVFSKILTDLSTSWGLDETFREWLHRSVMICDTLVDRIVSEALEPVGAVAEPYGLWAIKRKPAFIQPLQHPCVVYTDDLEPFLRLKLHILNLGHTFLADIWQTEMRRKDETVREILADAGIKQRLMSLYDDEVLPGFAARDMKQQASAYVGATLERFENPFLNHRISDIAQNHQIKIERRMNDFVAWARAHDRSLQFPRLEGLGKRT
jgi:tagaturonate reductase